VVTAVWLALWHFIPAPPSRITIAVGFKGGAFDNIAKRYSSRLARHRINVDIVYTEGATRSLKLIQDRNSGVDAGFSFSGVTNSEELTNAVSMGRVGLNPITVFYIGKESLDRLTQLKGRRIAVNLDVPPIIKILERNGVTATNTKLVHRFGAPALTALRSGEVDVIINLGDINSPSTQSLLQEPNIRLMSLAQAEGLVRVFPFLKRVVLPQGVIDFEKNVPADDVNLIAITSSLVVRKDLHPELIYLLAQTVSEVHGGAGILRRDGEFPTQTDPDFPVAEEAVDFYKHGPSFLQRYLPFWMIHNAKRVAAMAIAAIAVVIPLFAYAPRLYVWLLRLRLARLYRRLRAVDVLLQGELTLSEADALQIELENISRSANILPVRHSDLFFALMGHIELTRTRIAIRRGNQAV
jgi:TRAP-type uncharacterized transport system substrate-binding protein